MTEATPREKHDEHVERLTRALQRKGVGDVRLAVVLGSGWGSFAEQLDGARSIGFDEVDAMPSSSVLGHAGRFVVGEVGGVRVLVQQGRLHLYEGRSAEEVTRAVRAYVALGCRGIVLTNAAGSLRRDWPPGSLMRITDHVNQQGVSPLSSRERGYGSPYDATLGAALTAGANDARVPLFEGVYAGVLGPSYETPAEVRTLQWLGASAVGMSTVLEAVVAHTLGARVVGISCLTNFAAGLADRPPSHTEVLDIGRASADRFRALLSRAMPRLAAALQR